MTSNSKLSRRLAPPVEAMSETDDVALAHAQLRDYALNSVRRHAMPFAPPESLDFAFDGERYVGMLYQTADDNVNGYDRDGYMICQSPTALVATHLLIEHDLIQRAETDEARFKRESTDRASQQRRELSHRLRLVADSHEISGEPVTVMTDPLTGRPAIAVIDPTLAELVASLLQEHPAQLDQ